MVFMGLSLMLELSLFLIASSLSIVLVLLLLLCLFGQDVNIFDALVYQLRHPPGQSADRFSSICVVGEVIELL